MKKILSISLLMLYLVTSTGFSISVSYCMGKVENIVIDSSAEDECFDNCSINKMNCCSSITQFVKIKDEQQRPSGISLSSLYTHVEELFSVADQLLPAQFNTSHYTTFHLTDRYRPLYLSYNNFRI